VNARQVGDTACPPPRVRFPTRAIRSARRSSYAARTSLVAPASERASLITCVQVLSPTVLAVVISIDRCYCRLCHLPPADAMIDITQVVLLSVRQELRSEYADSLNFSSISSAFSNTAFLSRLRAGPQTVARPQDSYILNGCRSYYPMLGKRWAATNTTPLFRGMQALLLRVLNRRGGVNRYPQCRLR